jgi:hypothetical protein
VSLLQTILVALIPLAIIGWRLRRLLGVLRGEGSKWRKGAVALLIVVGIASRATRYFGNSSAAANPVAEAADASDDEGADSVRIQRTVQASDLIAKGEEALTQCDTATASATFQQLAGIGVDMMNADSLAGDPLFFQGVALAGLRDTVNAKALVAGAARLDKRRHIADKPEHASQVQRVIALSGKHC